MTEQEQLQEFWKAICDILHALREIIKAMPESGEKRMAGLITSNLKESLGRLCERANREHGKIGD